MPVAPIILSIKSTQSYLFPFITFQVAPSYSVNTHWSKEVYHSSTANTV